MDQKTKHKENIFYKPLEEKIYPKVKIPFTKNEWGQIVKKEREKQLKMIFSKDGLIVILAMLLLIFMCLYVFCWENSNLSPDEKYYRAEYEN